MKNVTALVLFCSTAKLIEVSIESFRKFYPDMKLIIVDNSGKTRPESLACTKALKEYCKKDKNAELVITSKNLGHGLGMTHGFKKVKTPYVYVFESDVIMNKPGLIEAMLKKIKPSTYAVGPILMVSYHRAQEVDPNEPGAIRRLWPYSSLISLKTYFKYPVWNSDKGINAAPLGDATRAIEDTGKSLKLLVEFNVDKYVTHLGGRSRAVVGIPKLADYRDWE